MKIFKPYIVILAALAASCTPNVDPQDPDPQDTTSTLVAELSSSAIKQSWAAGDAISVYTGSVNDRFVAEGAGTSAKFTGPAAGSSASVYYALYPYTKNAPAADGVFAAALPSEQEAVAGSVSETLHLCAAKSESRSSFTFRGVYSGIRFRVTQTGITAITLRSNGGEALAGEFRLSFDSEGNPKVGNFVKQCSSISLAAPQGGFVPGEWYSIVTVPCALKSGFTFAYTLGGTSCEVAKSQELNLSVGTFADFDKIDEKPADNPGDDPGDDPGDNPGDNPSTSSSLLWEEEGFKETVTVTYSGTTATVKSSTQKISYGTVGAHVWVNMGDSENGKKAEIILSGSTTDGSLKIYGEKKMKLTLNGVSITSSRGPAVNIQNGKRVFLHLADGTTNTLSDAATWSDDAYYASGSSSTTEDRKATFFAEGRIIVSGTGKLTVTGKAKSAIASDDFFYMRSGADITIPAAANHGIKVGTIANPDTDDYDSDGDLIGFTVMGGNLNISVAAAGGKAINSESNVKICAGNITLTTTGTVESSTTAGLVETTSAACIKADKDIKITGGTLICSSSGAAGKGLNADGGIIIGTAEGGRPLISIKTTGGAYGSSSGGGGGGHGGWGGFGGGGSTTDNSSYAKAIRAEGQIVVYDCDMSVYTARSGAEGIESKLTSASAIDLRGGDIVLYCNDDCINAAKGGVIFNGSRVFAWSYNNDSIDSNYNGSGAITIKGGVVLALSSAGGPEMGVDSDSNAVAISGGYVFSVGKTQGNGASTPTTGTATQCSALMTGINLTAGQYLSAFDQNGKTLFSFRIPFSFTGSYSIISCPGFESGGTYTIKTGSAAPSAPQMSWEVSSTTPAYQVGFYTGGSAAASTTLKTIKFSSKYVKV